MKKPNNAFNSFIYVIFISVGIITIFYQVHFDDLWLDEMTSFFVADPSLTFEETTLRHNESDWHNPKLFNLILKFYLNFVGYDPHLARYLPLFYGSVSLIMIGIISYQIKKDNSFLLTTFLACTSIYIIKYSQELRPYSLLLLTSILNIFFFIKLLDSSKIKIINLIFFILFSLLNYSCHPFGLIILFSQITFITYKYIFFKKPIKFYLFLYLSIIFFYLVINYDYILFQISFDNYMLSNDIKNVIDGFYFPRFFGSKIMGYFYLFLLFFLILRNYKIIRDQKNNYFFFLILIIFSYLIPLTYSFLKTPVIHDRYIIFILVPIFILISCLIKELSNKRVKVALILFIVIITLANHYIEIFQRSNAKPQFNMAIHDIKKSGIQNIVLFLPKDSSYAVGNDVVSNYVKNINISSKNIFTYYQHYKFPNNLENFWLFCYKPNINYDCKIEKHSNYKFLKTKKYYQLESSLYSLR
jgi:hypothetical protein